MTQINSVHFEIHSEHYTLWFTRTDNYYFEVRNRKNTFIFSFLFSFPKCCHGNSKVYWGVNLPTLIDIAGFTNEDRERYVELLRIVFYGRLPEGESLAQADKYYKECGLEGVRRRYSQNNEALKVDRVIIVTSTLEEVPQNLIRCVVTAARPSGVNDDFKRSKSLVQLPYFF